MNWKRPLAITLAAASFGTALAACSAPAATAPEASATPTVEAQNLSNQSVKTPKYVFLFIGDGMSYPQIQSTADFLGALNDDDYCRPSPAWTTTTAPFWTAPPI